MVEWLGNWATVAFLNESLVCLFCANAVVLSKERGEIVFGKFGGGSDLVSW